MERISKHISYKEATRTSKDADNTPNFTQVNNMILLAENIFEPLRKWAGEPIRVTSFFRSEAVNKLVGGARNSQHTANNGSAIDIKSMGEKSNSELFFYILEELDFDQLIWEFGDINEPAWIHVSYKKTGNRKQVLRAVKSGGKTKYLPF